MAPELPYLAAAAVALATGIRREGGFPSNGIPALIATAVLVVFASATANTKAAPLVKAFGMVLLLTAGMGFGRALQSPPAARRASAPADSSSGAAVTSGSGMPAGASKAGSKVPGKVATNPVGKPTGPASSRTQTRAGTF